MGQDAVARDSVDGAFERCFEQGRGGGCFANRLTAGALISGQFGPVAEIAKVALVDLKCFRKA